MSQIEQSIRKFLDKNPAIERCVDLINRRSLARYLVEKNVVSKSEFEATIGALRRFPFRKFSEQDRKVFEDLRVSLKDNIVILDFMRDDELLKEVKNLSLNAGETFKIVVSTEGIKLFLDGDNKIIDTLISKYNLCRRFDRISEMSIRFPSSAVDAKGVLSYITQLLYTKDITINELLTASPELLLYLEERFVLEAYGIVKGL